MARLKSIGFELNSTGNDVEFDNINGASTIQTTTVRSGTYAMRVSSLTSGTAQGFSWSLSGANSNGPFFFRVYYRFATFPSAENTIFRLLGSASNRVRVTINNSGQLQLRDEDGIIGSVSSALSTGTQYRIEVQYDRTAAAGSHVVRALLDGVEFAGASNRNLAAGVLSLGIGMNFNSEAQTTGDVYIDDIAINDNSGSFQTSYPGEGEIIHLKPNATGDNENWTGTGDNYTLVDEVTPDDALTKVTSSTAGQIDDYNIEDTPAAMASNDTINVVQVGVRFNEDNSGADETFTLRIKASASGTVEESAGITPSGTTWVTNAVSAPRNYPLTLYDLPGASTTAWTKADLDSAQIGLNLTTSNSIFNAQVSTLWLLVDHKPTAAGTAVKDMMMMGILAFAR